MKGRLVAVCIAFLGLAAGVSSCASSAGPPHPAQRSHTSGSAGVAGSAASGPPAPAGYQRIGGAAQGISLDIPASWVAVDFSRQTLPQAGQIFGLTGASQRAFVQELQPLEKAHAVYAADVSGSSAAPDHFLTNINAYCIPSGIKETGSAGVATLAQSWASALQQLGARNIIQAGVEMGGVPGEENSYTLSKPGNVTLYATQLAVLPKANRGCYVTLTSPRPIPGAVLEEALSSVDYP